MRIKTNFKGNVSCSFDSYKGNKDFKGFSFIAGERFYCPHIIYSEISYYNGKYNITQCKCTKKNMAICPVSDSGFVKECYLKEN